MPRIVAVVLGTKSKGKMKELIKILKQQAGKEAQEGLRDLTRGQCAQCVYFRTSECRYAARGEADLIFPTDQPCQDGLLVLPFGKDLIIKRRDRQLIIPFRFLTAHTTKEKLMREFDLGLDELEQTVISIKKLYLRQKAKPERKPKREPEEDPEIKKAAEELLRDPNILNKFMKHSGKWLIMDETVRRLELLTCVSAYGEWPLNLSLQQVWSAGKSTTITTVAGYFEGHDTWFVGAVSPKAMVHQRGIHNEEQDAFLINLDKKIIVFLDEPEFHTLMMLKPLLSHDRRRTEYRFVGENLKTITTILEGWPACIFCSVQSKYTEEFTSRWYTASPSTAQEKLRRVVDLKGRMAAQPEKYEKGKDFKIWQSAFRLLKKGGRWKVAVPYAETLAKHFHPRKPADMRFFQLFLGLIKASAILHGYQREKDDDGRLKATIQEYEIARDIYLEIEEPTRYGVGENVLSFYRNIILPMLKSELDYGTYDSLTQKYYEVIGESLSTGHIRDHYLKPLEQNGLISIQQHPQDKRMKAIYVISRTTPPSLLDDEGFRNSMTDVGG